MNIPFYQTTLARRFFENHVPRAIGALERIATALEARTDPAAAEVKRVASALEPYSGPDPDEPINVTLTEKGKAAVANSPTKGQWFCERCGSTDVEGTFWCKLNTLEPTGDSASDDYWCPTCDDHVTVEFKETP